MAVTYSTDTNHTSPHSLKPLLAQLSVHRKKDSVHIHMQIHAHTYMFFVSFTHTQAHFLPTFSFTYIINYPHISDSSLTMCVDIKHIFKHSHFHAWMLTCILAHASPTDYEEAH